MLSIKNILVPVDFSQHSHSALSYAREFAAAMHASIHLVHVVEPFVYPGNFGEYPPVDLTGLEKNLSDSAQREIDELTAQLRDAKFTSFGEVRYGKPADEIVAYAEANPVDLICIATHGRSGFEHFLFGSTTEKVLRRAPCPVLTIRVKNPQSS